MKDNRSQAAESRSHLSSDFSNEESAWLRAVYTLAGQFEDALNGGEEARGQFYDALFRLSLSAATETIQKHSSVHSLQHDPKSLARDFVKDFRSQESSCSGLFTEERQISGRALCSYLSDIISQGVRQARPRFGQETLLSTEYYPSLESVDHSMSMIINS